MVRVRDGTDLWTNIFLVVVVVTSVGFGQEYCKARTSRWNVDADVHFALMLSLRKSGDGKCITISGESLQNYVAAAWVVDKLNQGYPDKSFIPGVKLGFELFDDCQNATYAARNALQMINPGLASEITECHLGTNSSLLLGIAGPSRSSTATEVSHLLKHSGIPIVSFAATAVDLSNKTLYPTFFRTAHPDTKQVKPVIEMLKQLKWTYVVVVHSGDIYGRMAATMLHDQGRKEGICFAMSLEISSTTQLASVYSKLETFLETTRENLGIVYFGQKDNAENLMYYFSSKDQSHLMHWIMSDAVGRNQDVFIGKHHVNGILTLSPSNTFLKELDTFYKTKLGADPLIQKYLQQNPTKKLSDGLVRQSDYVSLAVDSFYTLAVALKDAHLKLCAGSQGLCDNLKRQITTHNFLQFVSTVNVDYTSIPRFAPVEFVNESRTFSFDKNFDVKRNDSSIIFKINSVDLTNPDKFVDVGTYSPAGLTLNTSKIRTKNGNNLPRSSCKAKCSQCLDLGQIPMVFCSGDVYIAGIFSLHGIDPSNPFRCNKFRTVASDTIVLEAFLHAVRQLNKLTNIKFGAIALDDCYSPIRITSILSDYYSGLSPSNHEIFRKIVPINKTVSVIGPLSSGSTIPVAQFFTPLKIPVVSYSASSPDLDDRVNFPYFLRTVPSDIQQAKVMVDIVLEMEWEYVGLLYVGNNYGTKGKIAFEKQANDSGICVAEPIEIAESGDETALHSVVIKLQQQQVKIVVFFGIDTQFSHFLNVIGKRNAYGKFIIIASEEWGTKQRLLETDKKAARGSLTLKLETIKPSFTGFDEALLAKNLSNNQDNPWFEEFWQNQFHCSVEGGFNNEDQLTPCTGKEKLSRNGIEKHLNDQRVSHVMNAVYAIGMGIKQAKDDLCHDSQQPFPCRFFYDAKYTKQVWDKIRGVEFPGGRTAMFDENGNGAIGYKVYSIQHKDNQYAYVEVGSYDRGKLSLQIENLRFYNELGDTLKTVNSVCGNTGLCSHCVRKKTEVNVNTEDGIRSLDIVLVVCLVVVFIIVVTGTVLLIICLRKTAKGLSKDIQRHNCGGQDHIYQAVSDKRVYQNPAGQTPGRYSHSNDSISFMNASHGTITDIPNGEINRGFVSDIRTPSEGNRSDSQIAQGKENYTSSGDSVPMTITSSHPSYHTTDSDSLTVRNMSVTPSGVNPRCASDIQSVVSSSIPNGQIPQHGGNVVYTDHSYLAPGLPIRPTDLKLMDSPRNMQLQNIPQEYDANTLNQLYDQRYAPQAQLLTMSDPNLHLTADVQSPTTNFSLQKALRDQYIVYSESSPHSSTPAGSLTTSPPTLSPSESVLSSRAYPTEIELQLLQKQQQLQQLQQQEQLLQQQHMKQQQQQQQQLRHSNPSTSPDNYPMSEMGNLTFPPKTSSSTIPNIGPKPALPLRNLHPLSSAKYSGSVDSVQSNGQVVQGHSGQESAASAVPEPTFDKVSLDPQGVKAKISVV